MLAVLIARRSREVWTTSGRSPASRSCSPPRCASARPFSDRGTSTQPVKRFSAFQELSPWRSRIRVWVTSARGGGAGGLADRGRGRAGGPGGGRRRRVESRPLAVVGHDRDVERRALAVVELEVDRHELAGVEGAVDGDPLGVREVDQTV